MTRDMDYIRELLLEIEAAPANDPWSNRSSEKAGGHDLFRTLQLLRGAGLISVDHYSALNGGHEIWHGVVLTWPGHDFLDNIRDDTVWSRTKEKLSKVGGKASIEVIVQVATGVMKQLLGLP